MPELVTIPISFFEVAITFERPVFQLWIDRAPVLQGIFDALTPWSPSIDDTEVRNDGKPSTHGITLKLPLKRASFFLVRLIANSHVMMRTGRRRMKQSRSLTPRFPR